MSQTMDEAMSKTLRDARKFGNLDLSDNSLDADSSSQPHCNPPAPAGRQPRPHLAAIQKIVARIFFYYKERRKNQAEEKRNKRLQKLKRYEKILMNDLEARKEARKECDIVFEPSEDSEDSKMDDVKPIDEVKESF